MNNSANQRVVALVDMDCFYCQVEARLNPDLKGKPMAVVQYNQWKGGGIIAVNYEARDRGVTRHMRGDEAKEICPEIILVPVPTIRGKADLSNYRDAGDEVAKIFSEFSNCVQRASIDEAYLDLTKSVEDYMKNNDDIKPENLPNTYVVGHCNLKTKSEDERLKGLKEWLQANEAIKMVENANHRLSIGGVIIEKMRAKIFQETGFHCSAGIAHNKILAKLTAGLHKPRKQTILPHDSVPELYETLPIYKVRNLGGKLGKHVSEKLSITYMSELFKFSLQELQQKFDEKTGSWLYNIARGIDMDPVTVRLMAESIGCCKNFTGQNQLSKRSEVEHWLRELATEISERLTRDLEKNKRRAKLLTVSFIQGTSMTRCGPLNSYEVNRIASDALDLIKKFNAAPPGTDMWKPPIKNLGLSASKFTEELTTIARFFTSQKNGASNPLMSEDVTGVKIEKPTTVPSSETTKTDLTPSSSGSMRSDDGSKSFIRRYLMQREAMLKKKEEESKVETNQIRDNITSGEKEDEEPAWISLSEVIPDVNEAEPEVVNILPEALKKKFNERVNSSIKKKENDEKSMKTETNIGSEETGICPTEKCSECGKDIMLDVFLEHLDYHVAIKLSSEINRPAAVSSSVAKVSAETGIQSKRKKGLGKTPSKKMKSITSFFTTAPK